ncbi:hypothetical protein ACTXT7_005559 [Hymenolepis weldensis]
MSVIMQLNPKFVRVRLSSSDLVSNVETLILTMKFPKKHNPHELDQQNAYLIGALTSVNIAAVEDVITYYLTPDINLVGTVRGFVSKGHKDITAASRAKNRIIFIEDANKE